MMNKRYRIDSDMIILSGLWIVAGVVVMRLVLFSGAAIPQGVIQSTINPNVATWWELTTLPQIGEITAKKIVQFRADNRKEAGVPPFQKAEDLTLVHGIGPKTVQRIMPCLRFDE